MRNLLSFLFLVLSCTAFGTTVTIDPNGAAAIPLKSSQIFQAQFGFRPDDGSAQTLNPPLFSWTYVPDPTIYLEDTSAKMFRFQLSTNASFASPYWDITTPINYYNYLPPIMNADGTTWRGSNYWRVIYLSNDLSTVLSTSVVHHFTIAASATNWDRSMLADSNYLYGVLSPHPHMFFWATNRTAVASYIRGAGSIPPGSQSFVGISNELFTATQQSWWTNESEFTNTATAGTFLNVQYYLWEAGFVYQLSTNAIGDPAKMLDIFDRMWINYGYDRYPTYGGTAYPLILHWALAIDYLWPIMDTAQRSNAVYAVEQSVKFYTYEDWFYEGSIADPTRTYSFTNRLVNTDAAPKGGDSHQRYDQGVGLILCMALWSHSTNLQQMMPYYLNFSLARKDSYNLDEGRGYNQAGFPEIAANTGPDFASVIAFRAARLEINPLWTQFTMLLSYYEPVYYHGLLEPWGDLAYAAGPSDTLFYNSMGSPLDLGRLMSDGRILRQYNRQNPSGFTEGNGSPSLEATLGYYFTNAPEQDWADTAYIDPNWGYAVVGSIQPNAYGAFTNGVGFVTQARPDAHINHGMYADGSIQFWAYGAQISAGGAGSYSRHPMLHSGQVFVNGMGPTIPRGDPTAPWYARFTAFTNSSDFAFIQSDTSRAYQSNNFVIAQLAGNLLMDYYTSNSVPQLSSVTRSIAFPHHKYLVLFDKMTATTNTTFQWLWHYMETNSGSVDAANCKFSYVCSNLLGAGPAVSVYVQSFIDPALVGLMNMAGTNNSNTNPFTHEVLTDIDFYGIPYPRPNGNVWFYNKTASKTNYFAQVIFPVPPSESAPTITRISDMSVRVQQGTNDDTITVDSSTGIFTLDLNGGGGGGGGGGGTNGHINYIRATTVRIGG